MHQPLVAILAQAKQGGCPIGPRDTFFGCEYGTSAKSFNGPRVARMPPARHFSNGLCQQCRFSVEWKPSSNMRQCRRPIPMPTPCSRSWRGSRSAAAYSLGKPTLYSPRPYASARSEHRQGIEWCGRKRGGTKHDDPRRQPGVADGQAPHSILPLRQRGLEAGLHRNWIAQPLRGNRVGALPGPALFQPHRKHGAST